MKAKRMAMALMWVCGLLWAATLPAQTLKSPQSVTTGLRILNQVVGHTERLIAAKSYDQIPREAGEFAEGVAVLREGLAAEPASFKSKVEPLIDRALQASNALGDASKAGDEAAIKKDHEQFSAAVKTVIDAFPEDVRPKAGRGSGGPPPGP